MNFPKDFTLIDLETTGLSPKTCDIIEVGGIKVRDDRVVDTYENLINIPYQLPYLITNLTGITDDMLYDAPSADIVIPEFIDFIEDDLVIAHNAPFDRGFIRTHCDNHLNYDFANEFLDTVKLARKVLPHLKNHKLPTLISYYSVDVDNAHRALDDCKGTLDVYYGLKRDAGY